MEILTADQVREKQERLLKRIRDRAVKALKSGGIRVGQTEVFKLGDLWFVSIECSQPSKYTISDVLNAEDPVFHKSSIVVEGVYHWDSDTYSKPYVLSRFSFKNTA